MDPEMRKVQHHAAAINRAAKKAKKPKKMTVHMYAPFEATSSHLCFAPLRPHYHMGPHYHTFALPP